MSREARGSEGRVAKASAPAALNDRRAAENAADVPTIGVYGDYASRMKAIPQSVMSVLVGVGELEDGTAVLVPIVDVELMEASTDGGEQMMPLFSVATTFENAAFLVADLAEDFLSVSRQLSRVSHGDLRPEPVRTSRAVGFLQAAQRDIASTIELLESMGRAQEGESPSS